jgi:hypothetical protein
MDGKVGDEIVVDGRHTGSEPRRGEILEVMRTGIVHYRVRWDDGHESIFFPHADAHIVHLGRRARAGQSHAGA